MPIGASRVYGVKLTRQAVTAAITLIQLKAGASTPLEVLRCHGAQSSSTTSTQLPVQINRKSAAATVTPYTPLRHGPSDDPAAKAVGGTSATGVNASAEGTDTDILWQDVWNYLDGWLYIPTEREKPFVDAAGILGVKLPVAPGASVTLTSDLVFNELN